MCSIAPAGALAGSRLPEMEEAQPVEKLVKERFDTGPGTK